MKTYNRVLHTTIRNTKALIAVVLPTIEPNGFPNVVQKILLNLITDTEKEEKLTFLQLKTDRALNNYQTKLARTDDYFYKIYLTRGLSNRR